ncbi:MAG: carbamoyltransferase [Patescibacteria group bacterium]|nr:carbamoyltransferase [Patescibacteria group bacterium]
MYILGISAYYHDSAVCVLRDGEIIAAAEEERFSRIKHDSGFPGRAARYCLRAAGIGIDRVDLVSFYDKPFLKLERLLETSIGFSPKGASFFAKATGSFVKDKIWIREAIRKELGYSGRVLFFEHHLSHAASAFFASPFCRAAFLTVDGVGEWATTSYGTGRENKVEIFRELHFPHSLGLLYSAFTQYLGFKVNSGEYKVMGLAPYGRPRYVRKIFAELIDLKKDGSFRLNMDYFGYGTGFTMINRKFEEFFGGRGRESETEISQKQMDIARSIQEVTNEVMLRLARQVKRETREKNLCLAGGVALNCVANSVILKQGIFDNLWIQPAAGDAGGSLGAAYLAYCHYKDGELPLKTGLLEQGSDLQKGSLLGPEYSNQEIECFLKKRKVKYRFLEFEELFDFSARAISQGKVIGWFQGRMEFGPRALGSRSIIADARRPEMREKLNRMIKFRESFRPFAPAVLKEKTGDWFLLNGESPYMLFVVDVLEKRRSVIPAVTHTDYSARVQTVDRKSNPLFYGLIEAFYGQTGYPVIVNTSFNVRNEPIVRTPGQAYECFKKTSMDLLVIGNFVVEKK